MSKKKEYCSNYTCLTRTCSRHRCQHSGRYSQGLTWIHKGAEDCEMYKGIEKFATLYKPPKREE